VAGISVPARIEPQSGSQILDSAVEECSIFDVTEPGVAASAEETPDSIRGLVVVHVEVTETLGLRTAADRAAAILILKHPVVVLDRDLVTGSIDRVANSAPSKSCLGEDVASLD
jgi:hypothetical protein